MKKRDEQPEKKREAEQAMPKEVCFRRFHESVLHEFQKILNDLNNRS